VELWGECYDIETTEALDLEGQGLTGEIPSEIGLLKNLRKLNLRNNYLSGPIPSEIGNLSELIYLYLMTNHLEGSIPPEIGNLTQLSDLNLQNNNLSGNIPKELGNLKGLTHLMLYSNYLTGEIPKEIGNMKGLLDFEAFQNQLSGTIPEEICHCPLYNLNLYSNLLEGWDVPCNVQKYPIYKFIRNVNLSHNLIKELSPNVFKLFGLKKLDLFDNKLSDLPSEFCEFRNTIDPSADEHIREHINLIKETDTDKYSINDIPHNRNSTNINLRWNNFCPPFPICLTPQEIASQFSDGIFANDECENYEEAMKKYPGTLISELPRNTGLDKLNEEEKVENNSMVNTRNKAKNPKMNLNSQKSSTPSDYRYPTKTKLPAGKYFSYKNGLQVIIHKGKQGTGPKVTKGDILIVHYHGTLEKSGKVFSSSIDRGEKYEFIFGEGNVIEGWDQGFRGMREGSEFTLVIPSELAYKDKGSPDGSIPPNANLIFKINLMEIIK
jgi:FKBP-type peptidyl-prolyl cis-trans isomerase/Leucine-rich repeat (LRR) protein